MAEFSVLLLTAAPIGLASEAGGAFVKVDGREALLRSVELFLNRDNIKQIQLVIQPDMLDNVKRKYGGHLGFSGVKLVSGGPRWIDQLIAGAPTIKPEATHVLVHDAARPVVAFSDIDSIMAEAEKKPAVTLVAPTRGPLIEVDEGGNPMAYHLPERYMQILTPQAYARQTFQEIAEKKADIHASQLTLVKGSPLNLRIGGSGDAGLAKAYLNMLPKPKFRAPTSPFDEAQW